MSHYNVWTKHGERGIMMENNEEEEDDDSYPGHGFLNMMVQQWGKAKPTMREEAEDEASDEPADDLGRAIADAKRNCASEKEKKKLKCILEDHKKLLYPNCKADN